MVGLSFGGLIACCLAAYHPERVKAAILAGVAGVVGPTHQYMSAKHFLTPHETFEGWDKYNRAYWLKDYPDFARHFVKQIFSEPHSTKQIEDGLEWANDTTGSVLVKTVEARGIGFETYLGLTGASPEEFVERMRSQASRAVARELVLEAAADQLGIEVSDEQVEELVREQAAAAE